MKVNRLLLLAAASVLIGGGSFAASGKVLANQFLVAQNSDQPTEQQGDENPRRADFAQRLGLTDAQQAQLKQIHSATRQQIDAIFTPEQKSQMEAIRQDAKSKMDAVLTDQQRQQLQQLHQQRQQSLRQQS